MTLPHYVVASEDGELVVVKASIKPDEKVDQAPRFLTPKTKGGTVKRYPEYLSLRL